MTTIKEILAEFDEKFKKSDGWNPSSIGSALESEIKSFISSTRSHLIEEIIKMAEGMKKDEKTICPNCNGDCQEIVGENLVSMDMAIDAGDRSLEGTHHSYEYKMCEICEGTGKIEMPIEYNTALSDIITNLSTLK